VNLPNFFAELRRHNVYKGDALVAKAFSLEALQVFKRQLQIQRPFAAHDSSVAKFCFFLWHRFGDNYFAARREAESFSHKLI
jgi:hypothetical protein